MLCKTIIGHRYETSPRQTTGGQSSSDDLNPNTHRIFPLILLLLVGDSTRRGGVGAGGVRFGDGSDGGGAGGGGGSCGAGAGAGDVSFVSVGGVDGAGGGVIVGGSGVLWRCWCW